MTKRVLQTKCVGMAPDSSGHALAPPEIVYECEEPRRPKTTLYERFHVLLGLAGAVYVAAIIIYRVWQAALGH